MSGPRVAVDPPAGWVATEIQKPPIASSTGALLTTWTAHRSVAGDAAIVSGCVATPIGMGWVEDMRPAVEGRTIALAGASASKITGAPVDARSGEAGVFALRATSDLAGPVIGHARTFVGFDDGRVLTCFATCASTAGPGPREACDRSIIEARLEGSRSPPAPGLALRGATWAVHHPRPTAHGAFGLVVLLGVIAVASRRRPRSQIGGRPSPRRAVT